MKCKSCNNKLTQPEIARGICGVCGKPPLWDFSQPFFSKGGFIPQKSRCCGAPIKRTTGIIIEVCSACNKDNPPPARYAD